MKFSGGWAPLKKYGALALVILVGLILLVWPKGAGPPAPDVTNTEAEVYDLDGMEKQLGRILSEISGAGRVEVLLTLKTDMEVVVVQDTETRNRRSGNGGTADTWDDEIRLKTVLAGGSPIVLKRVYPEFLGALVVCDGASDAKVHSAILDSVASLTGLRADSVTVAQRKR
jgi:stage III sporulation protein AG